MKSYDPNQELLKLISARGGFVNTHAHLDRAFSLTKQNFHLGNNHLYEKWQLVDELKRQSTVEQIYQRMASAIEVMIKQGVSAIGTFIDVDDVIKDKAIKAAKKLRKNYGQEIKIKFANQVLKGVLQPQARKWFNLGAEFVDIIGGLPGKDADHEAEHIDVLLETGKRLKKMVHVHVDQLNDPSEKETEILAQKTIEHKMQGQVVAIHCISLAAQPKKYRKKVYRLMKKAKLMTIACPTAWIDSRRSETLTPIHNAITSIDEMIPENIIVGLGTDNIADIYKPFSDGNMQTELKFLLEACHFYDIEKLADIASINGRKILGIN